MVLSPWQLVAYHVGEKHVGRVAELVLNRDENRSGFNRIAVIGYAHNPENKPEFITEISFNVNRYEKLVHAKHREVSFRLF